MLCVVKSIHAVAELEPVAKILITMSQVVMILKNYRAEKL